MRTRTAVFAGSIVSVVTVALLVLIGNAGRRNVLRDHQQPIRSDFLWNVPPGYLQHFRLAPREGWSIGPVQEDRTGKFGSERFPPRITGEQDALLKACWQLEFGGIRPNASSERERRGLDHLLAIHPHAFYPEYRLSEWYLDRGDMVRWRQWLDRSLRDAPAVLAGRIQYEDGRPIAGYELVLGVCFIPPKSGVVTRPVPQIDYRVTTDSDGCYYLPIYRAPFFTLHWGTHLKGPGSVERAVARDYTLSWDPPLNDNFVSPVKVGVLPPLVARPDVRLHPPFDLTVGSDEKPIPFHGSRFHLSWDPYPGATGYRVRIQNVRGGTLPLPSNPLFSQVGPGERVLKLDLLLAGMHSIFNRSHVYELAVVAMQGDVEVSTSRVVCIQPMDALAPILLTTASLNKVLAPDYRVTSVASRGGGFVVTGTCAVDDYDEIWDRLSVLPGIYPGDSEFHPDASNPSRGTFTLSVSTAGEQ